MDSAPAADDARRSFDTWLHTTMLGADDSADDADGPPDNVIRGLD